VDLGFDAGARSDAEMLASCLPSRYHAYNRSLLWREPMYLLVIITRQDGKTYDFLNLLPIVGVPVTDVEGLATVPNMAFPGSAQQDSSV